MTERSYTLGELDTMRRLMGVLYRPLSFAERENLLRTYLVAGIGPEDLQARYEEYQAGFRAAQERYRKAYPNGLGGGRVPSADPAKPRRTLVELTKAIAEAQANSDKRYGHG